MMNYLRRTWCEINLDHLQYNIKLLRDTAQKELMAVVKADAYGHGDSQISRMLQECGVQYYAVSNLNEALNLRHAGITGQILILGYTPPSLAGELIGSDITQTVYNTEYALQLNQALADDSTRPGRQVKVHIKVDTGMHRIGFDQNNSQDCAEEIFALTACPHLSIRGIFTHFSCSDSFAPDDVAYTEQQMARMDALVQELQGKGMEFELIHAQNSAGITNYQNPLYNCVRAGISMYGLNPSNDIKGNLHLKPLLSLKTVITMVKTVAPDSQVSYGRTYQAKAPMTLATLAIGYADGYYRAFSNSAEVLIQGKRCRIVGRVCMDQLMVDVTGLKNVKMGDVATVIGTDGSDEITADELAGLANTINYEVVCSLSKRVPRVYYKGGQEIAFVDYSLEQ